MASKNAYKNMALKNKAPKAAFDLSKRVIFSSKVGELLPIWSQPVFPGDKVKLKASSFTRTMPVNTAAFAQYREHFEFFFVPYHVLYRNYMPLSTGQFSETPGADSIRVSSKASKFMPNVLLSDLHSYLKGIYNTGVSSDPNVKQRGLNSFGLTRYACTGKLLHYLGYDVGGQAVTNHDIPINLPSNFANVRVNLWPVLAYQKIYSDFYRRQEWEDNKSSLYNVDYLNGSSVSDMAIPILEFQNTATGIFHTAESTLLDLQYCSWPRDMFFGILPSPQKGSSVRLTTVLDTSGNEEYIPLQMDMSSNLSDVKQAYASYLVGDAYGEGPFPSRPGYAVSPDMEDSPMTSNKWLGVKSSDVAKGLSTSSFDILELRRATALQKFLEVSGSNKKDYPSQVSAHWNATPSRSLANLSTYLGGFSQNIQIGEVVNTNITGDNAAEIAGRGLSSSSGSIDFNAKEHGILMCIYHITPRLDIDFQPLMQRLQVSFDDLPQPELSSIGLQSVSNLELFGRSLDGELVNNLYGFAPRYWQCKTDFNIVLGSMNTSFGGTQGGWVAPLTRDYFIKRLKATYDNNPSISSDLMKVDPSIVDPIFPVNTDSTINTDQFNVSFDLSATFVRRFDRNSMPY